MLNVMPTSLNAILGSTPPGLDRIVYASGRMDAPETIQVTSEAFGNLQPIPARFTDEGVRISPPLAFDNIPVDAVSLALIVEDVDSLTPSPLCHALAWDIDPRDHGLQEDAIGSSAGNPGERGAIVGQNSFSSLGWFPPRPPIGEGPHRYAMQIFALDYRPVLAEGSFRIPIVNALQGHVLAKGLLIGTYERV